MRHFMNIRVTSIILCVIVFVAPPLLAQEWSAAQKGVWKNVEAYWNVWAKRDLDGFLNYFHDDYSGWFNRASLPSDKGSSRKWISHSFQTVKISVYEINPVAIKIHGNVAIVHYYFSFIRKDAEGKESNRSGRWTDILMKQGDKWVLIGDHGGPTSN